MKENFYKLLSIVAVVLIFSSCSLFKVTISTGDKALSKDEHKTRVATRAMYGTFCSRVISTADSINASTDQIWVMLNATRWKLRATSSAASAVYQTDPNIAMVNIWVLCRQMNNYMQQAPDSLLFGTLSPLAREAAADLSSEAEMVARKAVPGALFDKMQFFVGNYCDSQKPQSAEVLTSDLGLAWLNFIAENNSEFDTPTGTMSEVLNDMTERMSGYAQQYSNALTWSKDIIELRFRQDSINSNLMAQLDSLTTDFRRITLIVENSPELVDKMSSNLNQQFEIMITTLNRSINAAFANFDSQRVQLQDFIAHEREAILVAASDAAQQSIDTAMSKLPAMITKIIFATVAAMLILFALPFVLGYLIGRARTRRKEKKANKANPEQS